MISRQTIGTVAAVSGVLIAVGHLMLMGLSNMANRNHWMEVWLVLGLVLGVVGLLLLTTETHNMK